MPLTRWPLTWVVPSPARSRITYPSRLLTIRQCKALTPSTLRRTSHTWPWPMRVRGPESVRRAPFIRPACTTSSAGGNGSAAMLGGALGTTFMDNPSVVGLCPCLCYRPNQERKLREETFAEDLQDAARSRPAGSVSDRRRRETTQATQHPPNGQKSNSEFGQKNFGEERTIGVQVRSSERRRAMRVRQRVAGRVVLGLLVGVGLLPLASGQMTGPPLGRPSLAEPPVAGSGSAPPPVTRPGPLATPTPPGQAGRPGGAPAAMTADPPTPQVAIRVRVPAVADPGKELEYRFFVQNLTPGAPAHHVRVRARSRSSASRCATIRSQPPRTRTS